MRLRRALDDYKRSYGHETRFPGERRSTAGAFSGLDDRLVYVSEDGSLRDYSYPLTGLFGVEDSRFGVATGGEVRWFETLDHAGQGYVGDTALVETRFEAEGFGVRQRDLTVGRAHVTRFEATGDPPGDLEVRAFFALSPDGHEGQVSRLHHDRAVEAYHDGEHDFVAAATEGLEVQGQVQESLAELLADDPIEYPRHSTEGRYEDGRVSGYVQLAVPLEGGAVTLATLLSDVDETPRESSLGRVVNLAEEYDAPGALEAAAREQSPAAVRLSDGIGDAGRAGEETDPASEAGGHAGEALVADRRVLELLAADSGARTAGPDLDTFYEHSGGYGYTWYRDDAEISAFLLETDRRVEADLAPLYEPNVDFYLETQLPDGSWPHRVWPHNGNLAPGWANARLERGSGGADYQADQTGSVVAFLARYLRERDPGPEATAAVERTLERAVESLDSTLEADGLPIECQNAWENMTGRFAHTAATFLAAYAAVARAPVDDELRDHAAGQADRVHGGLDALWSADRGCWGLRLADGQLDERYDSGALALVEAHREYAAARGIDGARVDRLVGHVDALCEGLTRETGAIRGLVRFEGDEWRQRTQAAPKVWSVSTAWAANAATHLGLLLGSRSDGRADRQFERARGYLAEIMPGGSLVGPNGYLSEQRFDDGTPDCATPLGWPHALRMATVTALADAGELAADRAERVER